MFRYWIRSLGRQNATNAFESFASPNAGLGVKMLHPNSSSDCFFLLHVAIKYLPIVSHPLVINFILFYVIYRVNGSPYIHATFVRLD